MYKRQDQIDQTEQIDQVYQTDQTDKIDQVDQTDHDLDHQDLNVLSRAVHGTHTVVQTQPRTHDLDRTRQGIYLR